VAEERGISNIFLFDFRVECFLADDCNRIAVDSMPIVVLRLIFFPPLRIFFLVSQPEIKGAALFRDFC